MQSDGRRRGEMLTLLQRRHGMPAAARCWGNVAGAGQMSSDPTGRRSMVAAATCLGALSASAWASARHEQLQGE